MPRAGHQRLWNVIGRVAPISVQLSCEKGSAANVQSLESWEQKAEILYSNSSDALLVVGEQVLECSSQPAGLSFSQYREHISCERTILPNLLSPLLSRGDLVTKIQGFASKNKCSFSVHLPLGRLSMAAFGAALACLAEAFVHFTLLRVVLGTVVSLGMLAITMVLFFTFFIPKQVIEVKNRRKTREEEQSTHSYQSCVHAHIRGKKTLACLTPSYFGRMSSPCWGLPPRCSPFKRSWAPP